MRAAVSAEAAQAAVKRVVQTAAAEIREGTAAAEEALEVAVMTEAIVEKVVGGEARVVGSAAMAAQEDGSAS